MGAGQGLAVFVGGILARLCTIRDEFFAEWAMEAISNGGDGFQGMRSGIVGMAFLLIVLGYRSEWGDDRSKIMMYRQARQLVIL